MNNSAPARPILAVSGLTVRRGPALILDAVSWRVQPGQHGVGEIL
ncbi:MAG: hypothetical protein ABSH38_21450 [Verrucomicrobiota bacterium]